MTPMKGSDVETDASGIALPHWLSRLLAATWMNAFTLGWAVFIMVPTLISIGRQTWTTDSGAHGPLVFATGIWLLFHNGFGASRGLTRPDWRVIFAALALLLPLYTLGRAYDFLFVEAVAAYGIFLTWAYRQVGAPEMRRQLFPLFYLGFLIPLPGAVLAMITAPLQMLVSSAAATAMEVAGYPVGRHGVSLLIGPYLLLIEDACAGLNSLIGIIAVTLFYIYLVHKNSWRYGMMLVMIIIPVAILVNIIRVICLILLTYYKGDAVAQGFMHGTTGLVLFGAGLFLIFGIDALIRRFRGTVQ